MLADLFGIKPAKPAAARQATATITGPFGNMTLKAVQYDPSVQLAGGQAHGKAGDSPVVIVNKVGKGQAVLLNFSMADPPDSAPPKMGKTNQTWGTYGKHHRYYSYWSWNTRTSDPEASLEFLGRLLASVGVKPALQFRNQAGERFRNLEVARWTVEATDLYTERITTTRYMVK